MMWPSSLFFRLGGLSPSPKCRRASCDADTTLKSKRGTGEGLGLLFAAIFSYLPVYLHVGFLVLLVRGPSRLTRPTPALLSSPSLARQRTGPHVEHMNQRRRKKKKREEDEREEKDRERLVTSKHGLLGGAKTLFREVNMSQTPRRWCPQGGVGPRRQALPIDEPSSEHGWCMHVSRHQCDVTQLTAQTEPVSLLVRLPARDLERGQKMVVRLAFPLGGRP